MLIIKKKPRVVEISELLTGDVFEYKDDMYMLIEKDSNDAPRVCKGVDLSNGRLFIFSVNAPVRPLKAKMVVEFEYYVD